MISVPSTSEDVMVIAAKAIPQETGGAMVAQRGPKRKLSNAGEAASGREAALAAEEPPSKHSLKEHSGTVTASAAANAPDKSTLPLVKMRNGEVVAIDEQPSEGTASDIIVIEEITTANALQVTGYRLFCPLVAGYYNEN